MSLILCAASVDARVRAHVSRETRRGGPRGGDAVSRPLAFRRPGRARKRLCRSGPGAVRLAQPRAGGVAERRAGDERSCRRPTTPLVLRGAAPTVGWVPVALPQAAEDTAMRLVELYRIAIPRWRPRCRRAATRKGRQGDDMRPKPGNNGAGAMRQVARGAAKTDGGRDGPRIAALAFEAGIPTPMKAAPVGRLA